MEVSSDITCFKILYKQKHDIYIKKKNKTLVNVFRNLRKNKNTHLNKL